ncbi:type II secretion system F family protein [Halorarum salinum]|uniref:Type II secretion system F family protein n=1 Tax=Halorarum salinum TaxID=2743089 RepID=A0A7D5LBJ4_9EURY|nr:type II secretion system F family protein [Halobaculum salinum]QLG62873.1 type II secretion system F family protein [Halobaculum salinum]
MVGVAVVLPLVFVALVSAPVALARFSPRVDLSLTRVSLALFGTYVADESPRKREQLERLRAAHAGVTHRAYASKTLLYAGIAGVAGSVLGVYGMALLLAALSVGGDALRGALPAALSFLADLTRVDELGMVDLFPLLLVSAATVGAGSALATYALRWTRLDHRADVRAGRIEATLPRTVAFVYALSRSGMSFPAVLDTLAENEAAYGEAARELGVAVRDMNDFGTDVLTAMERMARRTPSTNMAEFGENLSSVLGSGRNLSEFLEGQYERYQDEAESRQERYLELLSTFAEAYVTVLVAGPLFLVTILVVVGLVLQDTTDLLRAIVYGGLPVASAAFVLYVGSITRDASGGRRSDADPDPRRLLAANVRATGDGEAAGAADAADAETTRADGGAAGRDANGTDGWTANRERLAAYDRFDRLLGLLRRPGETLLDRPATTALLTVPVGLWWVWFRAEPIPLSPLSALRALDSPAVEATLFVLVGFGLAYELDKRRTRAIERAVPDFLDRMASVNEAGLTVVGSVRRLTRTDLGALTPELRRTWRDVQWGADVSTALERMEGRVNSPAVSRAVALVTNAIEASDDVAPVLEIAADETRATQRLRRERRQVMVTYLLVIYVSFAVFLGIVAALSVSFVPAIENAGLSGSTGGVPGTSMGVFGGIEDVPTGAYVLLFYHAAVVQAICSGLVAGQLGEGRPADGVKHACVMLLAAYVTFAVIGP